MSPNIEYPFVPQLMNSYEELQAKFVNGTEVIVYKSDWRDDMKFLHHLTLVFKFYEENYIFHLLTFKKFLILVMHVGIQEPSLPFLLLFSYLKQGQHYRKSVDLLCMTGQSVGLLIKKGLQVLENNWKQEPSALKIPRSNQCAERAIKVMQELYSVRRKKRQIVV